MHRSNHGAKGLTLIELLVTIAVLAILLTIALPSFRTAIQNNRLATQGNDLVTAMQLARAESLKRRRPVIVCASSDGATCQGAWTDGWIVAEDDAAAGSTSPTLGQVIRVWGPLRGETTVDSAITLMRFMPRGDVNPQGDSGAIVFPVTLQMNAPDAACIHRRTIDVARSGRVSSQRVDCS